MMNRIQKGGLIATLAMAAAIGSAQGISVTVDGNPVDFNGTGPQYRMGRVLVPLRGVFEEMGANVDWRAATRTVIATKGDRTVRLRIGDRQARIDRQPVAMDVPAQIINGSTMVPIRFVSESLGANVRWDDRDRMVMISTDGTGRAQGFPGNRDRDRDRDEPRNNQRVEILESETVLPVRLDTRLSSNESRAGDRFTATVRTDSDTSYGILPAGTRVEGRVVAARPKAGQDPGMLELDFQRLRLPNGKAYTMDGQLISLDNNSVTHEADGTIRARSTANKDNRTIYAGYGAGAGLIIGLLTKKPIETTVIGGLLGYIAGQVQKDNNRVSDVRLNPGSEFGVRLTQDVAINQRDIR